mmetsp:Transcript_42180/g.98944  ORF Transcript_42180/g.98944 Transcript_42180/m.98944 type:complete len:464 (+) Transcript_42180:142-1533(+)
MSRFTHRFRSFGHQIFNLYERRPYTTNATVGGLVYVAGELVVQANSKEGLAGSEWPKISKIGLLGAAENGLVMPLWYNLLDRRVGVGGSTGIVLVKCGLDQMFFSTQQNGLFLGVCAYESSQKLEAAITEVKKEIFTTWLNDCAIWPIVTFFGFAAVPVKLLPTYMASVQFFWQLYLSSVAAGGDNDPLSEAALARVFKHIDTDGNGSIDASELIAFMASRGVALTLHDVHCMIKDANYDPNATAEERRRTQSKASFAISFEDFKRTATEGPAVRSAALWERALTDKATHNHGARSALARAANLDTSKLKAIFREIDTDKNGYIDPQELMTALTARGVVLSAEQASHMLLDAKAHAQTFAQDKASPHQPAAAQQAAGVVPERVSLDEFIVLAKQKGPLRLQTANLWTRVMPIASQESPEAESADTLHESLAEQERREAAIQNVTVGGTMLCAGAAVRRFLFKV